MNPDVIREVRVGPGYWYRVPSPSQPAPLWIDGHAYRRRTRRRKP